MWNMIHPLLLNLMLTFTECNGNKLVRKENPNPVEHNHYFKTKVWMNQVNASVDTVTQLCKGKDNCVLEQHIRLKLVVNNPSNDVALINIHQDLAVRTIRVSVLDKMTWPKCSQVRCTVVQICGSLYGKTCKTLDAESNSPTDQGDNNVMKPHVHTPRQSLSMRHINYITSSSRYPNTFYGLGPELKTNGSILCINRSQKPTATRLLHMQCRIFGDIRQACGITSERFGNVWLVFICSTIIQYGRAFPRITYFFEPDDLSTKSIINVCKHFPLTQREHYRSPVVSIALTAQGNDHHYMYVLNSNSTLSCLLIINRTRGGVIGKCVNYFPMSCCPRYLDVFGINMLVIREDGLYFEVLRMSQMKYTSSKRVKHHTQFKDDIMENLVCWIGDDRHSIALVDKNYPFEVRVLQLS